MRIRLRQKLILFAIAIAIFPLLTSGQTLIRIARDELKSSANDHLTETARLVSSEIDSVYTNAWLAPLSLIANAIDDENVNVEAIIALLTFGISDLPDIVALQITVEGSARPLLVFQDKFSDALTDKGLDPRQSLELSPEQVGHDRVGQDSLERRPVQVNGTNFWLATIAIPLNRKLNGRDAVLSARINLARFKEFIEADSFSRTGRISLINADGREVLQGVDPAPLDRQIIHEAVDLVALETKILSVKPYTDPDGEIQLGALSFPRAFDWVVVAETSEKTAYFTVNVMTENLLFWTAIGLSVAGLGAILFSLGMSRPILKIGQAVIAVGKGDFQTRVEGVKSRDEIGELADRINEMIVQVGERFQLTKFVSRGTVSAIQRSDKGEVVLGGSRKRMAMLFADIRGYTAFSESREPEVVVDVLNHYFKNQGESVSRNNGDIDKFVGDQLMAVFAGENMSEDALRCAAEIQQIMEDSSKTNPEWQLDIGIGVDVGDVVVGAMGSPDRMDYTVLGDHVNLAARLCAKAEPKQTMVSEAVYMDAKGNGAFEFEKLEPIRVKGKSKPIEIYAATLREPVS